MFCVAVRLFLNNFNNENKTNYYRIKQSFKGQRI